MAYKALLADGVREVGAKADFWFATEELLIERS
jgi:hypothetical protein